MSTIAPVTTPLARLAPLLARWIGLDTATVGAAAIERACRERMEATGVESLAAYVDHVTADADERGELIERVVVGESWFFRDVQVFEFLARFVRQIARQVDRGPVRILSAPCAGGEEPYSVAMALFDAAIPAQQFTIDAVDVSQRALERAAAGRYSANAFRNADLSFRDRWFQTASGGSQIDPRIRQQVRFIHGNLLDEACVARLEKGGSYDVVFCRNLLIYLDEAARAGMERTFDRLLAPDGVLLLGAAEPPIIRGRWTAAGETSVFALRRGEKSAEMPTARPLPRPPRKPQRPDRVAAPSVPAAAPAVPAPAASPPEAAAPAGLDTVLRQAGELANAGRLADAVAVCEAHQKQAGPSADLFFLTGMLHQSAGDLDRAEACFHKTLYLDAAHADALLALALVASQRGDAVMAEKYRQSAVRVAARGGGS
jgi:chemotaxis protein methyltransferase WspC